MSKPTGAEAARKNLPALLDRAAKGEATVVTRRGRPVAVIGPVEAAGAARGRSLLSLRGSGRGLWGKDPAVTIAKGRKAWP
jgi:prevent-host-death family protein